MALTTTIFSLCILIFSVTLHEVAHGFVAYKLGDPTAKYAGRLSLNPIVHLDPFGSVLLPIFTFIATNGNGPIFGFAKPVPVNPYNFKDQKWGELKVSLAGPAMNFLIGIFFGLLLRLFALSGPLFIIFSAIAIYNFVLGIFNLIPIPPLDGSHILFSLLPENAFGIKAFLERYGLFILVLIVVWGVNFVGPLAMFIFKIVVGRSLLL